MRRLASKPFPRLVAAVAVTVAGAIALAGCDLQENADVARGRTLFITQCGTCHTLAEAGTSAQVGPNLDAAFSQARANGMDQDTIEGVVEDQVDTPRPTAGSAPPSPAGAISVDMPADIVSGDDLDDVAAYVASVAGVPGIKPPQAPGGPGGQVFADNGCGGCHTLSKAGSTGTVGPNLDKTLPGQSATKIQQSIVDPGAKLVPGFPDAMPKNFGQVISSKDLTLLVQFLIEAVGGKS